MLTPDFSLRQNEEFVIIVIRSPFIKVSEIEFFIHGTEFKFYAKPYSLSLTLPGEIVEDDRASSKYDVDKGEIVAYLPKKNHGENFEDLGMITKLLSPNPVDESYASKKKQATPTIEVLSSSSNSDVDSDVFHWFSPQVSNQRQEDCSSILGLEVKYGFAQKYSHVFEKLQTEIPSIVDVPRPDHMTAVERSHARCADEDDSFDADHYLADLMDNAYLTDTILKYEPKWRSEFKAFRESHKDEGEPLLCCSSVGLPSKQRQLLEATDEMLPFTQDHLDLLKKLPKKEYLLEYETRRELYLGLVDLLLAYVYNHIVTEGDDTVESAWTVCKLSSQLSWLEIWSGSLQEVVVAFARRSLCFPLYRNWELSQLAVEETVKLLNLGRRKVLMCLLDIHRLLALSDTYFVLNDIFITDYCVWIQHASMQAVASLAESLQKCVVTKKDIPWELVELEEAARLVAEETVCD